MNELRTVPGVALAEFRRRWNLPPESLPATSPNSLTEWRMERDDAPIFRFLYRGFRPRRHLEFGTWQGFGTCLCLESSPATVWTINLPDGETLADGRWAYGQRVTDATGTPPGAVTVNYGEDAEGPRTYHRTDASSYIGRFYREKGLGHRVCQIYCDSRAWDTSSYPAGFFDSVLVDGGHQPEVVISDTRKAMALLRPGGLMLWHDYCPQPEVMSGSAVTRDVVGAIASILPELEEQFAHLAWIDPSYILVGIKK